MISIPVLSRLGYKLKKAHKIQGHYYLALAEMELPTSLLVAITSDDEIIDAQVFIENPRGALTTYNTLKERLFKKVQLITKEKSKQ